MHLFSRHRKKIEPRRRFGGIAFRNKVKEAANYKRTFNPSGLSLNIFSGPSSRATRIAKILGIAVVILAGYLTLSPSFSITSITVAGNHQVGSQQIVESLGALGNSRLLWIKKDNFFLMTQKRAAKAIVANLPTVKEVVSYRRIWPNKLELEIREHTPGFVVESDANLFLIDEEGVVVGQIYDPGKLLIVHDQIVENFVRGETLPNQKLAPFILSLNKLWSTKISTAIESAQFSGKSSPDVHFLTKAGFTVLFDTSRPVSVQLNSLSVILSKQIGQDQFANLAYIDLRLSKWAYYCFKESPCQQKEQPDTAGAQTQ